MHPVAIVVSEAVRSSSPEKMAMRGIRNFDIFEVSDEWQWWCTGEVGPLPLSEILCQICNDYIVACRACELYSDREIFLCQYCSAMLLMGHNRLWDIGFLIWT